MIFDQILTKEEVIQFILSIHLRKLIKLCSTFGIESKHKASHIQSIVETISKIIDETDYNLFLISLLLHKSRSHLDYAEVFKAFHSYLHHFFKNKIESYLEVKATPKDLVEIDTFLNYIIHTPSLHTSYINMLYNNPCMNKIFNLRLFTPSINYGLVCINHMIPNYISEYMIEKNKLILSDTVTTQDYRKIFTSVSGQLKGLAFEKLLILYFITSKTFNKPILKDFAITKIIELNKTNDIYLKYHMEEVISHFEKEPSSTTLLIPVSPCNKYVYCVLIKRSHGILNFYFLQITIQANHEDSVERFIKDPNTMKFEKENLISIHFIWVYPEDHEKKLIPLHPEQDKLSEEVHINSVQSWHFNENLDCSTLSSTIVLESENEILARVTLIQFRKGQVKDELWILFHFFELTSGKRIANSRYTHLVESEKRGTPSIAIVFKQVAKLINTSQEALISVEKAKTSILNLNNLN